MKKAFSNKSTNFWAQVLSFVLGIFAMAGAAFPGGAETTANEVVKTILSGGGVFAIGVIIAINIVNPLIHFFKNAGAKRLKGVFGSPNFWISLASLLSGLAIMIGIGIPNGTGDAIVGAVYARDWGALIAIVVPNVLSPIIRYIRDRNNAANP